MNLYIARNGESLGPYSEAQAQMYLTHGVFNPEDMAMLEGFAHWRPLAEVMDAIDPGRKKSRGHASPTKKPARSGRKRFLMAALPIAVLVGGYLILLLSWAQEKQRCWDVVNQTFDLGDTVANSKRLTLEEKRDALIELNSRRDAAWHRLKHVLETKPGFLTTDDRKELAHAEAMIAAPLEPEPN